MSIRAVLLGLLGACIICGFTYFNDAVMHQTYFVGNHMPFSVYGALVVFLIVVNPLLRRASRALAFSGRELAVALTLTLAACCIPSSNMMRMLTTSMVLPHRFARTIPSWKSENVIDIAPARFLTDISKDEDRVLSGFVQGVGESGEHISLFDIPWHAWVRPLAFWLPLIFSIWVAMLGLSLVVHKQWSQHEHLPYPVAQFARTLMSTDDRGRPSLFQRRSFWIGLAVILLLHLNNYANVWFPSRTVRIQTSLNLTALNPLFPNFVRGGGAAMFNPFCRLFFTVVGIAYFLQTDVSFSVGIAPFIFFYVNGLLARYGIPFASGGYLEANSYRLFSFGAYLGVFLVFLYTGRRYYTHVFRRAMGLRSKEQVETSSVWGARVFLVAATLFVVQLVVVGLDWPLAVLYTVGAVIFYAGIGRVIAETGIFFFQPQWFPCLVLFSTFGPHALGLQSLMIVYFLTVLVVTDGRESFFPYVVNSLKIVESFNEKIGKVGAMCVVSILVGLLVAVPVTLYFQYDIGANMSDGWGCHGPPKFPFDQVLVSNQKLQGQDRADTAGAVTGLARFGQMEPDWTLLGTVGLAFTLALALSFMRLRFAKWPIHPALLLVMNSWAARQLGWSFLVGAGFKFTVLKYGGVQVYQRLKPFVIGVIAGDMLGSFVPFLIGLAYYLFTGEPAPGYATTPG